MENLPVIVLENQYEKVRVSSEVMGKTFQAAQLTHESFLTIDHCKIFFDICQTELPLTSGV